ncbi:protoporphyrinogen oxidase isoform X4 [Mobula birostris]|uniref:protoporphyrinogen oxidase isoform X4 n=1 Tax=Mobula birostris TaxID=1983395 RepID=UPI003B287AD8
MALAAGCRLHGQKTGQSSSMDPGECAPLEQWGRTRSSWSAFYRLPPFSQPLARSLAREPFVTRGKETDESVHHFCTRRFGEEMAIYAVDSLCRGVFAGDSRKLSARSCFPAFFQAERSFGSVILGMLAGVGATKWDGVQTGLMDRARREGWAQWTLKGGMQTLPEAMEATLRRRGVEIRLHTPVTRLQPTEHGACQVLTDGGTLTADHVFSSVPARVLSSLLPPVWQPLAKTLNTIGSVSVAVVNMEYEGLVLPVSGFGHLVPSGECSEILGVVYDSCCFPQQDRSGPQTTRLTVMMGGSWFTEAFGDPRSVADDELLQRAVQAVQEQLGIVAQPLRTVVRVQQDCIPQYEIGHWKLLEGITGHGAARQVLKKICTLRGAPAVGGAVPVRCWPPLSSTGPTGGNLSSTGPTGGNLSSTGPTGGNLRSQHRTRSVFFISEINFF